MLTIRQAAELCRRSAHGSHNYGEGFQVLLNAYRRALPHDLNPTLENLWAWVDGYLSMEEASHGPTPLG